MKTTIVIEMETDKLSLWRALTALQNNGIKVQSIQHGKEKKKLVGSDSKISALCEEHQAAADRHAEAGMLGDK